MEYNGYSCPTYCCPYACHQDFCLKETTRTPLRRSWLAALHCFSCSGDPMGCLHSSKSPDLVSEFYLGLSSDFTSFWLASKWFLGCCYWPISWLLAVWMDYVAFLVSGQPPPIAALDPVWLLHTLSTTIVCLVPLIVCPLWGLSLWHGLNYLYSCPYTPSTRPSLCIIGEGGDREQDPCPASLDFCQHYIDLWHPLLSLFPRKATTANGSHPGTKGNGLRTPPNWRD
jgi:hypothetical protein